MTEAKEMGMERTLCNQQSLADKEIKKRKEEEEKEGEEAMPRRTTKGNKCNR